MPQLQIGDIVVGEHLYSGISLYKIDRITATQAISGTTKFKRAYENNRIRAIGETFSYTRTTYQLANDDLLNQYKIQNLVNHIDSKISRQSLKNLSLDQLTRIKAILDEEPK